MRQFLVTGATGFIGQHVVTQLLCETAQVRILARRPEMVDQQLARQVEVVRGDIRDAASVMRAMRGSECVLHLAGLARVWARDPGEFRSINVTGVGNVLRAAHAAGTARVVHVSTVLTLAPHRPARVRGVARRPTPYEESKQAGQALVEDYMAAGGDAVVVHPTRVYGPGPLNDANAVTRIIAMYLSGRLRLRLADGDAQANYVHVEDVAAGIVQAARLGIAGQNYVLGGENASLRDLLAMAGNFAGVHRWTIPVPVGPALAIAGALEWWGRIAGNPPITRSWVRVFLQDQRVDPQAACAALRLTPRPLSEGVREVVHFLQSNGDARAHD
jgi:farnesol dehydrogenase